MLFPCWTNHMSWLAKMRHTMWRERENGWAHLKNTYCSCQRLPRVSMSNDRNMVSRADAPNGLDLLQGKPWKDVSNCWKNPTKRGPEQWIQKWSRRAQSSGSENAQGPITAPQKEDFCWGDMIPSPVAFGLDQSPIIQGCHWDWTPEIGPLRSTCGTVSFFSVFVAPCFGKPIIVHLLPCGDVQGGQLKLVITGEHWRPSISHGVQAVTHLPTTTSPPSPMEAEATAICCPLRVCVTTGWIVCLIWLLSVWWVYLEKTRQGTNKQTHTNTMN